MHGLGFLGAVLVLAGPASALSGFALPVVAAVLLFCLGAALIAAASHLLARAGGSTPRGVLARRSAAS